MSQSNALGSFILRLYFAVVSAVTLFTLMYGTIDLLSIGLKTYVFPMADVPTYLEQCALVSDRAYMPVDEEYDEEEAFERCEKRNLSTIENYKVQKASDAVRNFALIIVSLPLFAIHFRFVLQDWKEREGAPKQKKK